MNGPKETQLLWLITGGRPGISIFIIMIIRCRPHHVWEKREESMTVRYRSEGDARR